MNPLWQHCFLLTENKTKQNVIEQSDKTLPCLIAEEGRWNLEIEGLKGPEFVLKVARTIPLSRLSIFNIEVKGSLRQTLICAIYDVKHIFQFSGLQFHCQKKKQNVNDNSAERSTKYLTVLRCDSGPPREGAGFPSVSFHLNLKNNFFQRYLLQIESTDVVYNLGSWLWIRWHFNCQRHSSPGCYIGATSELSGLNKI